jgi:hypothetical protein
VDVRCGGEEGDREKEATHTLVFAQPSALLFREDLEMFLQTER